MPYFEFTVDAALLKELGERLVGQPHIALAELIKNAYDADASKVIVRVSDTEIAVLDDGDGMTVDRFQNFWMRVGSPHKQYIERTTKNRRPTGSKGIGRLAVQFLGSGMSLRTSSKEDPDSQLLATVDWSAASQAGDLTRAHVHYDITTTLEGYADSHHHGVEIIIKGLNQVWDERELELLAKQVWQLQPPFQQGSERDFEIVLEHENSQIQQAFDIQMRRNLDIWSARVRGRLLPHQPSEAERNRKVRLNLEFAGQAPEVHEFTLIGCDLHALEFEIRIFSLYQKQRYGVGVQDAREYLKQFGGVHIYDGGFHLPYYGPETDWLRTEIDHSHRLSRSKLLPEELQIDLGLNNLPTNSRLYGVVRVDTSLERDMAGKEERLGLNEFLQIQASRDRLVDNPAYRTLRDAVRYALDYYAVRQTARMQSIPESGRIGETASAKVRRVEDVLESYRDQIPTPVYSIIASEVRSAVRASETDAETAVKQMGLLGALATAGIAAIAYEHEATKQLSQLEDIVRQFGSETDSEIGRNLFERLRTWIDAARQTRALFAPLNDQENRETRTRLRARPLLEEIRNYTRPLIRGVTMNFDGVDEDLRLPIGTLAEWSAIFQNVFINAANAMLDSKRREIIVISDITGLRRRIRVDDFGAGVDLTVSGSLFQPFVRKLEISHDRKEMGLGGMGMGLAIVRMVANNLGCKVAFVEPTNGRSTSFELSWVEK